MKRYLAKFNYWYAKKLDHLTQASPVFDAFCDAIGIVSKVVGWAFAVLLLFIVLGVSFKWSPWLFLAEFIALVLGLVTAGVLHEKRRWK